MSARINLGTYDAATLLHKPTTAAITQSGAGVVGVAAKVIDFGDAVSRIDCKAIVEVAAATVATGDQITINIQISDDNFAADIYNVGVLELGDNASLVGDTDVGAGRYEIPFNNVINGTVKRYCRAYATIAAKSPASPATSVSYIAYLVPA